MVPLGMISFRSKKQGYQRGVLKDVTGVCWVKKVFQEKVAGDGGRAGGVKSGDFLFF